MMENEAITFSGVFRRIWPYLVVLTVFWAISAYLWLHLGYEGSFRWWNAIKIEPLNLSALYIFTHFADGLILPGLLFLFFWRKNPSMALTAFIAVLATGLVAQFGKIVLFPDWHRPPSVFAGDPLIDIFHSNPPSSRSFPSGHATSAAAGGFFFAVMLSYWRSWAPLLVGLFTILVAWSRVIIGVHFPGDVFVGTMIGTFGSWALLVFLYPRIERQFGRVRKVQTGRVALLVFVVSIVVIVAQYIHLYQEF